MNYNQHLAAYLAVGILTRIVWHKYVFGAGESTASTSKESKRHRRRQWPSHHVFIQAASRDSMSASCEHKEVVPDNSAPKHLSGDYLYNVMLAGML